MSEKQWEYGKRSKGESEREKTERHKEREAQGNRYKEKERGGEERQGFACCYYARMLPSRHVSSPQHFPVLLLPLQDLAFRRNPIQMLMGRGTVVIYTDGDMPTVYISKFSARKLYLALRSVRRAAVLHAAMVPLVCLFCNFILMLRYKRALFFSSHCPSSPPSSFSFRFRSGPAATWVSLARRLLQAATRDCVSAKPGLGPGPVHGFQAHSPPLSAYNCHSARQNCRRRT